MHGEEQESHNTNRRTAMRAPKKDAEPKDGANPTDSQTAGDMGPQTR